MFRPGTILLPDVPSGVATLGVRPSPCPCPSPARTVLSSCIQMCRRQLHLATPLFFDRPLLMANSSPKKVWRVMPSVAPGTVMDCSIEFLLACGVGLLAGTVSKEDV